MKALPLKVLLAWITLVIVQMISGMIVKERSVAGDNAFLWFLVSNLLVATVLAFLAIRSEWHRLRLALALSGIPLLINLTNDIEGIVFLTSSGIEWNKEIVRLLLAAVLAVPLWMVIFANRERRTDNYRPFASRTGSDRLWRFAVSDLAYVLLYFAAGTIIWFAFSFVRDFYATQTVPSQGKLIALQFFVRGPIYVGVCLLMLRMAGLPLAVAMAFAILNSAALLMPTNIFPDAVRWVHFGEVVGSGFVFGLVVSWLWGDRTTATAKTMKQAA